MNRIQPPTRINRRQALTVATGLAASLAVPGAWAQSGSYPNRPIKLIVPFPAGISPDVVARLIGDKLGQALGQPVVIDNRPGAGGMIGAEAAALAPADGYNLFFAVKSVMAIAPHVYTTAKYNPMKDFKGVAEILLVPHVLTATPGAPYNTMQEFVDYAKRNPGKIDFASLGVGSQPHVALEAWAARLGIKLNHVPYKSNPSPDVMSGVVSLSVEASTTAIPLIKAGKVKALGISGAERIAALPDVPTMTEFAANLDPNGVIGNSWHGIFTPTGTPDDIVNRLNAEIVKIVKSPDVQTRLRGLGLTPTGMPAATLTAEVSTDHAYWGQLVKELGVKVE
jgi:tripartite-type tricarboxylate transporter receptor subunit TctC